MSVDYLVTMWIVSAISALIVLYMDKNYDYLKNAIVSEAFKLPNAADLVGKDGSTSPWMFDFKRLTSKGDFLQAYVRLFWAEYSGRQKFQVGGLEVGAIPLLSAIALFSAQQGRSINTFFVRKSRKKDGTQSLVEGIITDAPIILVDDLIHSGKSLFGLVSTLESLREKGQCQADVTDIFAILRFRDASTYQEFFRRDIRLTTLFDLNDFQDSLGLNNLPVVEKLQTKAFESLWYWGGDRPLLTPVMPKGELLLDLGNMYVGADSGKLVCLSGQTGEEIWSYRVSLGFKGRTVFSTPVICQNLVIFGSHDGNIHALERDTGKRAWVSYEADWLQGNLVVNANLGLVYAPLSFGLLRKQGKVVALEAKTGQVKWEYNVTAPVGGGITHSSQLGLIFFGTDDGSFQALDAKTGKLVWSVKVAIKPRGYPTVSISTKAVFFGGVLAGGAEDDRAGFYSLDIKTGRENFNYKDFSFGTFSTPCLGEDRVFFAALDKYLYCLDQRTGALLWRRDLGARSLSSASLISAGDDRSSVCVGDNSGFVQFFDTATGQLKSIIKFNERIVNGVIFDTVSRILYVPTQANEIFALKQKS